MTTKKAGTPSTPPVSLERIARQITSCAANRSRWTAPLAALYGVTTAALKQRVKRNTKRSPPDFAFQLDATENDALISQSVTSKSGRGGRRKLPWVFAEQGVAMLSSVLHSERAGEINVAIMRTFVKLRTILFSDQVLAQDRRTRPADRRLIDVAQRYLAPPDAPPKRRSWYGLRGLGAIARGIGTLSIFATRDCASGAANAHCRWTFLSVVSA